MRKKENNYIEEELAYIELKVKELADYIAARPLDKLTDRFKGTKLIANIEAQRKDLTAARKEYIELIRMLNDLRTLDDSKAKMYVRGDHELSPSEKGEI